MSNTLPQITISNVTIRQDLTGRYCINDLHRAAGGEKRHQPSDWLRNQQTQELITELASPGIPGDEQNQPVISVQGSPDTGGASTTGISGRSRAKDSVDPLRVGLLAYQCRLATGTAS